MSRPELDLSVYLVTDTALCGGPDAVVATTRQAARAGATLVQFRDHQLCDEEFVTLGRRLAEVLAGTGVPLLVDDRVHLVATIGAQGAHVGQSDVGIMEARTILGPDAILGLTAQTREQIGVARNLGPGLIDYLGVGALHPTGTKPETGEIGLDRIASLVAASPWPVCAIGGVKADDAADLARIGCEGMSVVSAICGQADPTAATHALSNAWTDATAATAESPR